MKKYIKLGATILSGLLMFQTAQPLVYALDSSSAVEVITEDESTEIYDYEAMENLGVESQDATKYDSLEEIVYELLADYGLDASQIGFAYTNLETGEELFINEDEQMIVASMYKVPMVAMYIDLIDQGYLSWDSQLTYSDKYYQDGAGDITANPKQAYYSLDDLAYQAIVYSDNTASLILYYYYVNNFGSFRNALLEFVDYYEVPEIFYYDNYGSAYIMNLSLQKVALDPSYQTVVDLMKETYPKQFFSLYVNNMATKYGRYENMLNDSGIYYEGDEPIYTLLIMVRDNLDSELFISELNLRVNEWVLAQR